METWWEDYSQWKFLEGGSEDGKVQVCPNGPIQIMKTWIKD